ncbi:MAG TPA: hypothetical protein VM284_03910 [Candidatus Limnocylindria bacterium]|nr:hypothetical protein [Candidatus Limnocylindria bacterium]
MTVIRIATIDAPLNSVGLRGPALDLVRRALAVGLLRDRPIVGRLDLDLLRGIAREASAAGIGRDAALELLGKPSPRQLGNVIGRLEEALASSPMPDRELGVLLEVFDVDQLATLLDTSAVSLRRYVAGTRAAPDALAARIHWLALVSSDLAGAYNALGIRRWFDRPRTQLDGKSPRQLLRRGWDPDDKNIERLRDLAAALAGPGGAA